MSKKALLKIAAILAAVVIAGILAACTMTFDKYDDDEYIIDAIGPSHNYNSSQTNIGDDKSWSVKSFGGVEVLKRDVELEDDAVLDVKLDYKRGDFKIVAVSDGELFMLIEKDSCDSLQTTLKKGRYTIKAVGSDAEFSIKYKL